MAARRRPPPRAAARGSAAGRARPRRREPLRKAQLVDEDHEDVRAAGPGLVDRRDRQRRAAALGGGPDRGAGAGQRTPGEATLQERSPVKAPAALFTHFSSSVGLEFYPVAIDWRRSSSVRVALMGGAADPYAVLGVAPSASDAEIHHAYRAAVRRSHPDAGGSSAAFEAVQEAYETLRDARRRRAWDDAHRAARPRPRPAPADPVSEGRSMEDLLAQSRRLEAEARRLEDEARRLGGLPAPPRGRRGPARGRRGQPRGGRPRRRQAAPRRGREGRRRAAQDRPPLALSGSPNRLDWGEIYPSAPIPTIGTFVPCHGRQRYSRWHSRRWPWQYPPRPAPRPPTRPSPTSSTRPTTARPTTAISAPLAKLWSTTLPGPISYPLIANGIVYVTARARERLRHDAVRDPAEQRRRRFGRTRSVAPTTSRAWPTTRARSSQSTSTAR